MIGSQKEEQKWKQGSRAALRSNNNLGVGNYDVQFDKDVPLKNRMAFAQTPSAPTSVSKSQPMTRPTNKKALQTGYTPRRIGAPRTMGDLLRYNREMKAEQQNADIAKSNDEASIAAFNAERQAESDVRTAGIATDRNRILEENYKRTGALANDRLDFDRTKQDSSVDLENKGLALEAERNKQSQALGEAQIKQIDENIDNTQRQRDAERSTNTVKERINRAKLGIANSPDNPELQEQLRAELKALEGTPPTPISPEAQAKLDQKDFEGYSEWRQTRGDIKDEQLAIEMYRRIKEGLQSRQALGADTANPITQKTQKTDPYTNLLGSI